MSLIVLHTHYTYIVPQETKSIIKSIKLGKPVETRVSHLTVYLFLIKKLKYWECTACRLSLTLGIFGLELRYVHD